ncbi:hypothetical protein PVAP13_6NG347600 [Panicum virgatum]|uniref:Uncharacterized protein n=1 Tax=Panicum virgatum TaxID=38727 RepID=A0A8T0R3W2_PANVG|nr:hypothetical protein PVAP13_6NG347600 [Panicum virgatum]KAG2579769.1 hypothetical protein PVAP13_6NG347600 [Panicum virgatum]
MEEALIWRPATCNLCCCPLCGGDGLSPTCYICIYPAFGRLTLNSGHCSIPLMEIPMVSDWHQELISLLWTWQDVPSLGLISHHACDDNFLFPLFPCSSSARLKSKHLLRYVHASQEPFGPSMLGRSKKFS